MVFISQAQGEGKMSLTLTRGGTTCHERAIGCAGVLKDWFKHAYEDALKSDGKRLTAAQLE